MVKIRKQNILLKIFHYDLLTSRHQGQLFKGSLDLPKDNRMLMGPLLDLLLGLLDLFITVVLLLPWLLVNLVSFTVVYIKQVEKEGNGIQDRYDLLNIQWCIPFGPLKKIRWKKVVWQSWPLCPNRQFFDASKMTPNAQLSKNWRSQKLT